MQEIRYSFRLAVNRAERTYTLTERELVWSEGGAEGRLPYDAIATVRVYDSPAVVNRFLGGVVAPGFSRCVIWPRAGVAHGLSSNHYVSLGNFENRSASFHPFVKELFRRVAAASPGTAFVAGMPWGLWALWAVVVGLTGVLTLFAAAVFLTAVSGERRDLATAAMALVMTGFGSVGTVRMARMLAAQRSRRFAPGGPVRAPGA